MTPGQRRRDRTVLAEGRTGRTKKSARLGVEVPAAVLADVRSAARSKGTTIRQFVLEALPLIGVRVPRAAFNGSAAYPRASGTGTQLCIHVPRSVMTQLVRLQRHRRCARRVLILEALRAAGIDVPAEGLAPDRRRGPDRTPRRHYAQSVSS